MGEGAAEVRADTAPGFASVGGGDAAASVIGAAVLVAAPRPIPPFSSRRISAGSLTDFLTSHYFFFFAAFLAFLFLAIADLRQRLKEAKHGARPYRDGLFNRRNEPRRIESFCLSTYVASGLEEKLVINMSQSAKNISGGLHRIGKAARVI
jgi:hypothetical protein